MIQVTNNSLDWLAQLETGCVGFRASFGSFL